jgi:hypothetical protein
MDEMIYTFIKFKNGESIITLIDKETEKEVFIVEPVELSITPKINMKGEIKDSVILQKWLHPFTESIEFTIPKEEILIMCVASQSLSRYYENFLFKPETKDEEGKQEISEKDFDEKEYPLDTIKDVH